MRNIIKVFFLMFTILPLYGQNDVTIIGGGLDGWSIVCIDENCDSANVINNGDTIQIGGVAGGGSISDDAIKNVITQNLLDSLYTSKYKLSLSQGSDSIGLIGVWNSNCNCYIVDTLGLNRADQINKMYIDTITKYLGDFVQFDGFIKFDSLISSSGDTTMDISYHTDSVYVVVNGKTFVFYAQGEQPVSVGFTPVYFHLYRSSSYTLNVTQDEYEKVTNGTDDLFSEGLISGCTHSGDSVQLPIGKYDMNAEVYFSSSSGSDVWNTGLFKNNILQPANSSGYWSSGANVRVLVESDGDDWFSFRMMNDTNSNSASIGRVNWSAHKISD